MSTTTSQETAGNGFAAAGDLFTKMWSDFAAKMAASGMSMPGDAASPDMARQMRDTFFNTWSQACDRYMRSEEFLSMMRDSMKSAIELRKQMVGQLGDWQHTMQGASRQDADRLLHSIASLEQRVNETFDQLIAHLDAINDRIDALEKQKPAGKTTKQAKHTSAKKKTTRKKTSKKKARKSAR